MNIAVLITCFNRKPKTISCLKALFEAEDHSDDLVSITVYLTDDGSSDGTADAVLSEFQHRKSVNISKGDGSLFWSGGMRNSWKLAIEEGGFDGYLWLNDDTVVDIDLFEEIVAADQYCKDTYGMGGIYIGSTSDSKRTMLTYGGSIISNKLFYKTHRLVPSGSFQGCQLGNGNIAYISKNIVEEIGILNKDYVHGVADYDYTYSAYKKQLPVFVLRHYVGRCERDHQEDGYTKFVKLSFKDRINFLYSSKGLQFREYLIYQRKFFPFRYPFVLLIGWFKVFFPSLYVRILKMRL